MSVSRNRFSFAGMSEQKICENHKRKFISIVGWKDRERARLKALLFLFEGNGGLNVYKPMSVRVMASRRIKF